MKNKNLLIVKTDYIMQALQALNIYWQAWGYEQAQIKKQIYIKKTSKKLDKIVKISYMNYAAMYINFPTEEMKYKIWKNIILKKNLEILFEDLECFSSICLQGSLPVFYQRGPYPKYNKYNRTESRIFQSFNKRPKKLDINSVFRVDAILCLF